MFEGEVGASGSLVPTTVDDYGYYQMKFPDENSVAKAMTCGAVVEGIPRWKCVSRECSCCPKLSWPKEESGEYEDEAAFEKDETNQKFY